MKVITTVVGSLQTNCYLLIDEETKSAALIDPGDEAEKLLALVKSEGVTLKYILLTHGHRDHTLAVPALKKALPDVPVYIGEADAHSTGIYHYPMADLVPDLKYYGEGDTLPLGSLTIKVLATPGHTLGGRDAAGRRRDVSRRHAVCRLDGPHRPPRRQRRADGSPRCAVSPRSKATTLSTPAT